MKIEIELLPEEEKEVDRLVRRCLRCPHLNVLHGYDGDCGQQWCEVGGCGCQSHL